MSTNNKNQTMTMEEINLWWGGNEDLSKEKPESEEIDIYNFFIDHVDATKKAQKNKQKNQGGKI